MDFKYFCHGSCEEIRYKFIPLCHFITCTKYAFLIFVFSLQLFAGFDLTTVSKSRKASVRYAFASYMKNLFGKYTMQPSLLLIGCLKVLCAKTNKSLNTEY